MYVPRHFAADEAMRRALLDEMGAADLVTMGTDGLVASFIPLLYEPDAGPNGSLIGHLARANPQWRDADGAEALVIVHGPDAYVSPSMYPSKAEDGRVVPTWNYVVAHVHGRLVVHDDAPWVERLVRRLTEHHEQARALPWSVSDAPEPFIAAQQRAIVGIEVQISRVEAKAKLSQNRPPGDAEAVIAHLEAEGHGDLAAAMRARRA